MNRVFTSLGYGLILMWMTSVHLSAAPHPIIRETDARIRRSDFFVVHDARKTRVNFSRPAPLPGQDLVDLEIDTLLMAADRVRAALYDELKMVSAYSVNQIYLILQPTFPNSREIRFVKTFTRNGWRYQLEIPDRVDRAILVRGIAQAVLHDYANRGSGEKFAEVPLWLSEGLVMNLLTVRGNELVPHTPKLGQMILTMRHYRGADYLRETRAFFQTNSTLTFGELSRPATLSEDNLKVFQNSAKLLVAELQALRDGPVRLERMLRLLPNYWNWENAFLLAFDEHFQRLLDVEKWWAVVLASSVDRDFRQALSARAALERLEGILLLPAQERIATNALPQRLKATLQEVVREWEYSAQMTALQQTVRQLVFLRAYSPPAVGELIESYIECLQAYRDRRTGAAIAPDAKRQLLVVQPQSIALFASRNLDALDERRHRLWQLASSGQTGLPPAE